MKSAPAPRPQGRRYKIDPRVKIKHATGSGTHKFKEIFTGFDKIETVRKTFGESTPEVLDNLSVEVFPKEGYMGVSDEDGHMIVSQFYLNNGEEWSIYLDVIHELVHVRQFRQGKELFDRRYSYGDRPTEIEAYRFSVEEARKIGMSEEEIFGYLEVPWMSKAEHQRLANSCDLALGESHKP